MKLVFLALFSFLAVWATVANAKNDAEIVDLPPDWQRVELDAAPGSLSVPTVKYTPNDHRNAAVMIAILGRGDQRVKDRAALNKFHRKLCERYLAHSDDPFEPKEFTGPNGIGTYASFEDPALKGKPDHTGDYKFATVAAVLLNNRIVVLATIYTDEISGRSFEEALAMVKSVSLSDRPAGP